MSNSEKGNGMRESILLAGILGACLVACCWMVTSCEREAERETTRRQWIAGTNVLTHDPMYGVSQRSANPR